MGESAPDISCGWAEGSLRSDPLASRASPCPISGFGFLNSQSSVAPNDIADGAAFCASQRLRLLDVRLFRMLRRH